ncbi:MAG: flagellar basal-body rod protein FlgF [Gammaproteobacteria bacterium]|nr:flagellar basal-body rod protein FlgF [Gammaproteobacteria bacterium]
MDKMLYLAMTAAKQTMVAQEVNSNNLANVSTTGFKADLEQFRSMQVEGEGLPSRTYSMTERPGIDVTPGAMNTTGRELDVAVKGDGWIAVQAPDGSEAYTRAGELHVSSYGILETASGHAVLGDGGPIAVPQSQKIEIGIDGSVSVRPIGAGANEMAEIGRIKLVNPETSNITKGEDGLIRTIDGSTAIADLDVQLVSGALETSNVSAIKSMVKMIELSRQYEMQIKMMKTAEENDAAATQIMKMS